MNTQPQLPIISAKLNVPAPRRAYIRREHLQQRLARLADCKVTVIKGAPGSGKSTLLAAHLSEHPSLQARWVSLDANDNDVRTLWSYVLEALKPDLGEQADELRELLGATLQASDVDAVLVEVVNRLQPDDDLFLVLDDAHYVTDPRAIESLQFFLRYSSERMHLILLTRDEPTLYLGELRMTGQLLEIDNDDLKVTATEARLFLTNTLGLQLDGALIDRITTLAEGWIGGLQLLGVALEYKEERVESIASMSRPVVEYLSGEILTSLAEDEQRFLVAISILPYFDETVCRAVTGNDAAGMLLHRMIGKHVFVVTVDETRGLYRYHQLFQQFLQQQFMKLPVTERQTLHRRAAEFYSGTDNVEQSVHHYMEAEQYDDALGVIGRVRSGVKSWRLLQRVPLTALEGKPDFIYHRLFSHLAEQQYEQCAHLIAHFRGGFGDPLANRLFDLFATLVDNGPFELGPERWTVQNLRDLALSDETKAILYCFVAMILSMKGQEREALTCLSEAHGMMEHVENPYIRFYCMELKSQVKEHMGDLRECEAIYGDMFRLVEQHSFLAPILVTAHIGIVGILLKSGRLAEAQTYLDKVKHRVAHNPSMEIAYLYNELELHILKGKRETAVGVADRLLQRDVLSNPLYCAPVLRYMLLLGMADGETLAGFQFEQIAAPHWQDYLLQARLLLRKDRGDEALELVNGRLGNMRKQQAKLPLVDTLLVKVQALAAGRGAKDQAPERNRERRPAWESDARNALREAVHYSYENNLLAPFLLADEPIAAMVRSLQDDPGAELHPGEAAFLDELISHWAALDTDPTRETGPGLLSERETEVLHVLAEGATNKQIADRLHVSVATVKTHLIHIYSKLHVANRVEAVQEARRRGIIPS